MLSSWLVLKKCGVWFDAQMKLENLPDGGHDKVIWKRSRDCSRDKALQQRNSETWWRLTTATLLGISFGTYMRRRTDVLMGRRGYVPLRRLGDVPLRRLWVFHLRLIWDVVETYWQDVVITFPWDVVTTYQHDFVKLYHWDVLAMFHLDVFECFIWDVHVTSLRQAKRRRYDVAMTSCCRVGFSTIREAFFIKFNQ